MAPKKEVNFRPQLRENLNKISASLADLQIAVDRTSRGKEAFINASLSYLASAVAELKTAATLAAKTAPGSLVPSLALNEAQNALKTFISANPNLGDLNQQIQTMARDISGPSQMNGAARTRRQLQIGGAAKGPSSDPNNTPGSP